jgi:hypothetical protein
VPQTNTSLQFNRAIRFESITSLTTADNRDSRALSAAGIALRLFITCWMVYALHFATNSVREIYPALSLADHFSFDVSEYAGLHPDIFEISGRGAFINNNPGASIVGSIPYALSKPIVDRIVQRVDHERKRVPQATLDGYRSDYPMAREFYRKARERGLDVKLGIASAVVQVFGMAPISALAVTVMFFILLSITGSKTKAVLLALLYAFATPVFYRTAQLNQNLLLAHCALFTFASLWRPWDHPSTPRRPHYLLAGLLCGWCVVLDYSGLVVVLGLSVYAVLRRRSLPKTATRHSDLVLFAAGLAVAVVILVAYQWSAFGHPLLPAQRFMPATVLSRSGYHGMDWPQLDLLWSTAFGLRFGLFTSAPLLLLVFYFPAWKKRGAQILGNLEIAFILIFTVLFFLFCSANQFGRLQFNSGVRYIVPVVPFLFVIVARALLQLPRVVAVLIALVTTYWSWCLAMYRDVEQGMGVFESIKQITLSGFRLPWITTLEKMGYIQDGASVLPLFALSVAFIWVLWNVRAQRRVSSEV